MKIRKKKEDTLESRHVTNGKNGVFRWFMLYRSGTGSLLRSVTSRPKNHIKGK